MTNIKHKVENNKIRIPIAWRHVIILVIGILLYGRTTNYDFIGLDDVDLIVRNYSFNKDISNINKVFLQDVFKIEGDLDQNKDYYRPLYIFSFMFDAIVSGSHSPKWYRFMNIMFHIFAAILVFKFFLILNINQIISFLFSLVFLIHPALNIVVGWIPGRNDSLLLIFILLSLINYIKYLGDSKKSRYLILHVVFFCLALFTKENAVFIPILTAYFLLTNQEGPINIRILSFKYSKLLILYFIIVLLWYYLRSLVLEGTTNKLTISSLIENTLSNWPSFSQYIGKMLFPFGLSVLPDKNESNYIWAVLVLGLISLGIYYSKRELILTGRWKIVLLGVVWLILFLVPSLSATFFAGLEHRLYVPLVGFYIVVAEMKWFKNYNFSDYKLSIGIFSYLILFAFITVNRLPAFSNRFDFYKSALNSSNHSILTYLNLGKHYEEIKEYDKAIEVYKKGLQKDSMQMMLHNNIGGCYLKKKMFNEAEIEFNRELINHPHNVFSIFALGLIYKERGQIKKAINQYKKALEINNNFIYAYQELYLYYQSIGMNDSAQYFLNEVNKRKK